MPAGGSQHGHRDDGAIAEPGKPYQFPAKDVVDAGFLELVRYGIRKAGTPLIEDSLRVVDAVLRVETPAGPCWRRYNHDGYGQRSDGGPFTEVGPGTGVAAADGRTRPLRAGGGRDAQPYLRAMEGFASRGGMLPEQVWDAGDIPGKDLFFGRPTGSAMPLMWAHAEYVKLLRSVRDGVVFDRVAAVADRYLSGRSRKDLEIWKFSRRARSVSAGATLRIQDSAPFRVRWSLDDWRGSRDTAIADDGPRDSLRGHRGAGRPAGPRSIHLLLVRGRAMRGRSRGARGWF